ncbi:Kcnb2, partial [Symbiodinium microadriaticum]
HRPSTCETPACKNDPEFCPDSEICEPVAPAVFEKIEAVCIGVFTVDYGIRVITVAALPARLAQILPDNWDNVQNPDGCLPDPEYPWYRKIYKYCTSTMNVIDLIAILPFYVGFATDSGSSVSIVRILRLARVLRVFKISGFSSGMGFISAAIKSATPAIGILLFFTVLGVILFGSVIYFLESGSFVVNRDFPDGAYVRWDVLHEQKERTPFSSILVSCYWAIVTSTTVGYGLSSVISRIAVSLIR